MARRRAWATVGLGLGIALAACSRASEGPQPRAVPELLGDASVDAGVAAVSRPIDASAPSLTQASPLHLLLRAPLWWQGCPTFSRYSPGCALPLLERLSGGGLVFAVEFARARASGPEAPFSVELLSKGLETDVLLRSVITQSPAAFRWVWADDAAMVLSDERDYMRSGPRMNVLRSGPKGFSKLKSDASFWSATRRDGSVLALSRAVREIPNSSMYPKGSEYYANGSEVLPARIAVLAGPGPAPAVPPGACPIAMTAAPDGTLVVAVETCGDPKPGAKAKVGVLRYPPKGMTAKVEWLADRGESAPPDPAPAAAGPSAIWVGIGDALHAWDGKAWTVSTPAKGAVIASVSPAASGDLWVAAGEQLLRRTAGAWTEVPLPLTPADPLEAEPWAVPAYNRPAFVRVPELWGNEVVREGRVTTMTPLHVDAAGDDVVVLAHASGEAFVLSTKARGAVARVPSVSSQRAKLAALLPRDEDGAPGPNGKPRSCSDAFLVLPEGASADAVRATLLRFRARSDAGAPPSDAGRAAQVGDDPEAAWLDPSPRLAEGLVEGKSRLVVWATEGFSADVVKALAPLAPKRLCGPAVVVRDL